MATFSFLDDYSEGAHPDILRALTESNFVQQAAYGEDSYSAEATTRIKAHLGNTFDGAIHYVASGTMANIVSISSCLRPHEAPTVALSACFADVLGFELSRISKLSSQAIIESQCRLSGWPERWNDCPQSRITARVSERRLRWLSS
jgi:hypothetical protein